MFSCQQAWWIINTYHDRFETTLYVSEQIEVCHQLNLYQVCFLRANKRSQPSYIFTQILTILNIRFQVLATQLLC